VAQARKEFGSRARASEETRSAWSITWLEQTIADVRFALRSFARRKSFAFASILCLAIGIAANVLIFSLVQRSSASPTALSECRKVDVHSFLSAEPVRPETRKQFGHLFLRSRPQ